MLHKTGKIFNPTKKILKYNVILRIFKGKIRKKDHEFEKEFDSARRNKTTLH